MATLKQNSEALKAVTNKLKNLPKRAVLTDLVVTKNGEYVPEDENSGFKRVSVQIPNKLPQVIDKTVRTIEAADLNGAWKIGFHAFNSCFDLSAVEIPPHISEIGRNAFAYCSGLTSVVVPDNSQIAKIGEYGFYKCSALEALALPRGLTSIGKYAFQYCTNLKSIHIPRGVTTIPYAAFEHCENLETLTFEEGSQCTKIDSLAFDSSGLKEVVLPEGVTVIGNSAFNYCFKLTSITLPSSTTEIGAMLGHNALETIICKATTPPTLHSNAFSYSYNVKQILVPRGSGDVYKSATNWSNRASKIVEGDV